MKIFVKFWLILILSLSAKAKAEVPKVKFEYSFGLDMFCPQNVVPETLSPSHARLIPKIPKYRKEALAKLPWIQSEWNKMGTPLMKETVKYIGKPFPMNEIRAAVFLCPRFPFMGTPLALNIISYLESSAKDIPSIEKPLPIFFFVSTTFHELLHKYIHSILEKTGSQALESLDEPELVEAHLHLFALQKVVFESLGQSNLLNSVEKIEAVHGPDYVQAWKMVHGNDGLFDKLISELRQ